MTEMTKRMILFSGSVNPELAEEIAKYLNVNLGNIKHEKFANGEIYARYQESIRGADVFLIQSVCASETFDVNDALMELLIMADAAKRASARSISAVIAHYGYARQDRKAAPREPITAKLVADLLEVSGIDNIITVDLHQDAIQGFFDIPVNHMTAMPIFVDYFRNKGFDPERAWSRRTWAARRRRRSSPRRSIATSPSCTRIARSTTRPRSPRLSAT